MGTETLQECGSAVPPLIAEQEKEMLARRAAKLENLRRDQIIMIINIYWNWRHDDGKPWAVVSSALVNAHLCPAGTLDAMHGRIVNMVMWLCAHPSSTQSRSFRDMVEQAEQQDLHRDVRDDQLKSTSGGIVQWLAQNESAPANCRFKIVAGVMINEQCKFTFVILAANCIFYFRHTRCKLYSCSEYDDSKS